MIESSLPAVAESEMSTSERVRVAILDDYQNVAFTSADLSRILDRLAIDSYPETLHDEDALVKRLEPYAIICAVSPTGKTASGLISAQS